MGHRVVFQAPNAFLNRGSLELNSRIVENDEMQRRRTSLSILGSLTVSPQDFVWHPIKSMEK